MFCKAYTGCMVEHILVGARMDVGVDLAITGIWAKRVVAVE